MGVYGHSFVNKIKNSRYNWTLWQWCYPSTCVLQSLQHVTIESFSTGGLVITIRVLSRPFTAYSDTTWLMIYRWTGCFLSKITVQTIFMWLLWVIYTLIFIVLNTLNYIMQLSDVLNNSLFLSVWVSPLYGINICTILVQTWESTQGSRLGPPKSDSSAATSFHKRNRFYVTSTWKKNYH